MKDMTEINKKLRALGGAEITITEAAEIRSEGFKQGYEEARLSMKWVDINDALPEGDDFVLVCWGHEGDDRGMWDVQRFEVPTIEAMKESFVTHWMNLPELPK